MKRTAPLNREAIVMAAMARIDADGLEAFSLREVARDLGVYPTALYWHVPGGRNGLLAAVAAVTLKDVAPPLDDDACWRDWLLRLFKRYREALRRHPNVAPLLGAQFVSNTGVDPILVERTLAALTRAGFKGPILIDAYNAVIAGMVGYVTLELASAPRDAATEWESDLRSHIHNLDPVAFPIIAEHQDALLDRAFILRWSNGSDVPLDGGFRLFCEALISGLGNALQTGGASPA